MTAGGRQEPPPPLNGGELLLRLVQNPQISPSPSPLRQHGGSVGVSVDPAVAAVGPTIPLPLTGYPESRYYQQPNFFSHGLPQSSASWPHQHHQPAPSLPPAPDFAAAHRLQFNFHDRPNHQEQSKLMLGTMSFNFVNQGEGFNNMATKHDSLDAQGKRKLSSAPGDRAANGSDPNWGFDPRLNLGLGGHGPDFGTGKQKMFGEREMPREIGPTARLGVPAGSALHSETATEIRESLLNALSVAVDRVDGEAASKGEDNHSGCSDSSNGAKDLSEQLGKSLLIDDEADEVSDKKKKNRDKDFRSDPRGKFMLPQRARKMRTLVHCRGDIHRFNSSFLEIYESLMPGEEELMKQKQLLTRLQMLVRKEWPNAKLFLYGSCANSFGFSKSDIDVCLATGDQDIDKAEILLKLADILQSDNLEDVQALTRARVPIAKLKDPVTGIACDICINNVLAVVNTKLLRDYAQIDGRLRQLAFIVKHWAKSRGVNETYHGTLSSYAYVLMCIHFLQQRKPAILPCLQMMDPTYAVTVDGVEYAYFDRVDRLQNFGARNRESIAQLVWGFFNYWAYAHDYTNSVISVRTGSILSKQTKDWTRRVGNDRHLICIEDPFETSHDLGRVVDKHSIRVIREEFERAAEVLQCAPYPCRELFKPFDP